MKLQAKAFFVSCDTIKKQDKTYHIAKCLIDEDKALVRFFVNQETFEKYKNKERFSPILVNVDVKVDTNKIFYSI